MHTLCIKSVSEDSCFSTDACAGYKEEFSFDETLDLASVHTFTTTTTTVCDDSPILRAIILDLQHGDDPDSNHNTIGIETLDGLNNYLPVYQGGQVMDAIIASGTPAKLSGRDFVMDPMNPHIATYAEIIQDMADAMAWGQTDGGDGAGSWVYSWNSYNDNSAAQ